MKMFNQFSNFTFSRGWAIIADIIFGTIESVFKMRAAHGKR